MPPDKSPADKPSIPSEPRFSLGRLVATPAALTTLIVAKVSPWALTEGTRLLSAYALPDGEKVWVITEADRSATTLLLPADY